MDRQRIAHTGADDIERFAVDARGQVDGITLMDGLDAWSGQIGAFPEGALAIHDDDYEPLGCQ